MVLCIERKCDYMTKYHGLRIHQCIASSLAPELQSALSRGFLFNPSRASSHVPTDRQKFANKHFRCN